MIAISDWHDFRPCVDSTVGDVVQLVRTLPCRWLESYTVTAWSLGIPDVPRIIFKHLREFSEFSLQTTSL